MAQHNRWLLGVFIVVIMGLVTQSGAVTTTQLQAEVDVLKQEIVSLKQVLFGTSFTGVSAVNGWIAATQRHPTAHISHSVPITDVILNQEEFDIGVQQILIGDAHKSYTISNTWFGAGLNSLMGDLANCTESVANETTHLSNDDARIKKIERELANDKKHLKTTQDQLESLKFNLTALQNGFSMFAWQLVFGEVPPAPDPDLTLFAATIGNNRNFNSLIQLCEFDANVTQILMGRNAYIPMEQAVMSDAWYNTTNLSLLQYVAVLNTTDTATAFALQSDFNSLESSFLAETARATSAEADLLIQIQTETIRAQGSEANIVTEIQTEVSRAEQAEATLSTQIQTEVSRAESSEFNLRTNYQRLDLRTHNLYNLLETTAQNETSEFLSLLWEVLYSTPIPDSHGLSVQNLFADAKNQQYIPLVNLGAAWRTNANEIRTALGQLNVTFTNDTKLDNLLNAENIADAPPSAYEKLNRDLGIAGVLMAGVALIVFTILILIMICKPSALQYQPVGGSATKSTGSKTSTVVNLKVA